MDLDDIEIPPSTGPVKPIAFFDADGAWWPGLPSGFLAGLTTPDGQEACGAEGILGRCTRPAGHYGLHAILITHAPKVE